MKYTKLKQKLKGFFSRLKFSIRYYRLGWFSYGKPASLRIFEFLWEEFSSAVSKNIGKYKVFIDGVYEEDSGDVALKTKDIFLKFIEIDEWVKVGRAKNIAEENLAAKAYFQYKPIRAIMHPNGESEMYNLENDMTVDKIKRQEVANARLKLAAISDYNRKTLEDYTAFVFENRSYLDI